MAYFDSPKNKAIWDKEIARLEAEREKRKQEDPKGIAERPDEKHNEKAEVREITLEELENIVRRKKGLAAKGIEPEMRKRGARVNDGKSYERENGRKPEIKSAI